jgi:hypothetical protein
MSTTFYTGKGPWLKWRDNIRPVMWVADGLVVWSFDPDDYTVISRKDTTLRDMLPTCGLPFAPFRLVRDDPSAPAPIRWAKVDMNKRPLVLVSFDIEPPDLPSFFPPCYPQVCVKDIPRYTRAGQTYHWFLCRL